jgi:serine/threonine protein kinase
VSSGSTGWNPDGFNDTQVGSCILEHPLSVSRLGAVFLARQERPRRYVAVKVIHRQLAPDVEAWQEFLARFQREADASAALDHVHIVPIYEFGETSDLAYLVMPFLPDGSLATRLIEQGPLSLPETVQYIEQVASALDYAHARGIIHRDVKPSNMLLHPDGRVLLADFGLAHPMYVPDLSTETALWPDDNSSRVSLTQPGVVMGTPEYMAPEQVRREMLTPATDQYGLGIATYELLGGQTPFGGADVPTVLRRQVLSPPPPLRIPRWSLPARVEDVIFWSLAKDPADRPATAGQFAQALRAALEREAGGSGAGWSDQGASSVGWKGQVPAGAEQEYSSQQRALPDSTLPLPQRSLPRTPAEPEHVRGGDIADGSTIPVGAGDPGRESLHMPAVGAASYIDKYASGARQWPLPQFVPQKQGGVPAVIGLALASVALVVLAVLIINSVHAAFVSPAGTPSVSEVIAATPSPHRQPTPAPALPTATRVPPTATSPPRTATPSTPSDWLVVSPIQVALDCHTTQSVTVQLTNTGPSAVSWAAQPSPPLQSGLAMQPISGVLAIGATQSIILSVTAQTSNSAQGTELFAVVSGQQAGKPAQVSYTVAGCGGTG